MKNILIALCFIILIGLGIFLDSLFVNWVASFLGNSPIGWIILTKIVLWFMVAFFTGGPIFALSFILIGAIKTASDN